MSRGATLKESLYQSGGGQPSYLLRLDDVLRTPRGGWCGPLERGLVTATGSPAEAELTGVSTGQFYGRSRAGSVGTVKRDESAVWTSVMFRRLIV